MLILFLLCSSVWKALRVASGEHDPSGPAFKVGIFDPLFAQPFRTLRRRRGRTFRLFAKCVANVVAAPWTLAKCGSPADKNSSVAVRAGLAAAALYLAFLLAVLNLAVEGSWVGIIDVYVSKVARGFLFKPKIPILVKFGRPRNRKCWHILRSFGTNYGHLVML
jgi:hypothetical protein